MLMPRLPEAEYERVIELTPGGLMRFPMLLRRKRHDDDDELLSSYLKPDNSRCRDAPSREGEDAVSEYSSIQHRKNSIPEFTICREVKVRLCWLCALCCRKCEFTSSLYKLYNEIKMGR